MSCTIMECPSSSLPMNSILTESCSSTYQSVCGLQCEEGFDGNGDPSYVCDMLSDGSVTWMTIGRGWSCERSRLLFCFKYYTVIVLHILNTTVYIKHYSSIVKVCAAQNFAFKNTSYMIKTTLVEY